MLKPLFIQTFDWWDDRATGPLTNLSLTTCLITMPASQACTLMGLSHLGLQFPQVALPKESGVGREAATVFIRQNTATTDHTKSTHNLTKNSQLVTSIQHQSTLPTGPFLLPIGLPTGSSFNRNSRASTPFPLTYTHSS